MKERRYWMRAVGQGLMVMLTALLVYDAPPDWSAYWKPGLQGLLAAGAALGLNVVTRSGRG